MLDAAEFDAFYTSTCRRLVGQVYAMIGNLGNPEAWVRTVAYRIAVSSWRKATNRLAAHRRHGVAQDVPGAGPEHLALVAALRELPYDQRRVVVLHRVRPRLPLGLRKGTQNMSELFDHQLAELSGQAGAATHPQPAGSIRRLARRRTALRNSTAGLLAVGVLGATSFGVLQQVSGHPTSPLDSPSSSSSPSSSPPPLSTTPDPNQSSPSTAGTSVAECTLAQLNISGSSPAGLNGAGHRGYVLVFRNTGSTTCRMRGYPGVDGLDGRDRPVEHARRTTNGYLGGARYSSPMTDLRPGDSASALVEAVAFRPADGSSCTPYANLLVTPPDETHSVKLQWDNDGCSTLEIHPVVPGTSGRN